MSFADDYAALNEEQRAAADHDSGPAVVCAVVGSGKTRLLTMRIRALVENRGADPARICACAFGREAAKEIATRLYEQGVPETLRIGTVHSVSWEIVRSGPAEYGADAKLSEDNTLKYALQDILSRQLKVDREIAADNVERFIALAKARCLPAIGPGSVACEPDLLKFARSRAGTSTAAGLYVEAYRLLEQARVEKNLVTYDDMPMNAALLLTEHEPSRSLWQARYDHVLVDEAQDLSAAQYKVVDLLGATCTSTMLIGDCAQAIYAFRGASVQDFVQRAQAENVVRFASRRNYRCPPSICAAATKLIAGAAWNLAGAIEAVASEPSSSPAAVWREYATSDDEAAAIAQEIRAQHDAGRPWSDFAVLYRITSLLRAVETALQDAQVPYRVASGACFYDRAEVQDLLAYLRVASLLDVDGAAARRVVNRPFRYLGKAFVGAVEARAVQKGEAFLDALVRYRALKPFQAERVRKFVAALKEANRAACAERPPAEILELIDKQVGYVTWLTKDEGTGDAGPGAARAANVHELFHLARGFASARDLLIYADQTGRAMRLARSTTGPRPDAVLLSTIHAIKGQEYEDVYLVGAADGFLPLKPNSDRDEERRLFYVALTRAKRRFVASCPRQIALPHGVCNVEPSPYISRAGLQNASDAVVGVLSGTRFGNLAIECAVPEVLVALETPSPVAIVEDEPTINSAAIDQVTP